MRKINLGQSMLELLMAVAIVGIVLIALVSLSTKSIGNTTFSSNKSRATRLTQEASEWIRNERDTNWSNFVVRANLGVDNLYCLPGLTGWPGVGACDSTQKIVGTEFIREVTLRGLDEQGGDGVIDTVSVGVVTYWLDGVGRHEARTTTLLTNWKNN